MTDIEKKALALVNEVTSDDEPWTLDYVRGGVVFKTLCRAIEQHDAFRQEVSDAVEAAKRVYGGHREAFDQLDRFIIAKPDPLVEVWDHMIVTGNFGPLAFRAAIEARGGRIVWEGE